MRHLRRFFTLITTVLATVCFFFGIHLRQQNKTLEQSTANLPEMLKEEHRLSAENDSLQKKWEDNSDIWDELSKGLILPQKETAAPPMEVYDPVSQRNILVYENYLSGFITYDNCIEILSKLCNLQRPILITSLSIHRNIAHNYALQISMTYQSRAK